MATDEPTASGLADPVADRLDAVRAAADLQERIWAERMSGSYGRAASLASELVEVTAVAYGSSSRRAHDARAMERLFGVSAGLPAEQTAALAEADASEFRLPTLFARGEDNAALAGAERVRSLREGVLGADHLETRRAQAWIAALTLAAAMMPADGGEPSQTRPAAVATPAELVTIAVAERLPEFDGGLVAGMSSDEIRALASRYNATPFMVLFHAMLAHERGDYADAAVIAEAAVQVPPIDAGQYTRAVSTGSSSDELFNGLLVAFNGVSELADKATAGLVRGVDPDGHAYPGALLAAARVRLVQARIDDASALAGEALRLLASASDLDRHQVAGAALLDATLGVMTGADGASERLLVAARLCDSLHTAGEVAPVLPEILRIVEDGPLEERVLERAITAGRRAGIDTDVTVDGSAGAADDLASAAEGLTPETDVTGAMLPYLDDMMYEQFFGDIALEAPQEELLRLASQLSMLQQLQVSREADQSSEAPNVDFRTRIGQLRRALHGHDEPTTQDQDAQRFRVRLVEVGLPDPASDEMKDELGMFAGMIEDGPPSMQQDLTALSMLLRMRAAAESRVTTNRIRELANEAEVQLRAARFAEADRLLQDAVTAIAAAGHRRLSSGELDLARPIVSLGHLRLAQARHAEAAELFREVIRLTSAPQKYGELDPVFGVRAMEGLIRAHVANGDLVAAAEARIEQLDRGVAGAGSLPASDAASRLRDARIELAELERAGKLPAADAGAVQLSPEVEQMLQQMPPAMREQMREQMEQQMKAMPGLSPFGQRGQRPAEADPKARFEARLQQLRDTIADLEPQVLFELAEESASRGEHERASRLYREALAAAPAADAADPQAPDLRAMMAFAGGFSQGVCLDRLAESLRRLGRWEEAADALGERRALPDRPGMADMMNPAHRLDPKLVDARDRAQIALLLARAASERDDETIAKRANRALADAKEALGGTLRRVGVQGDLKGLAAGVPDVLALDGEQKDAAQRVIIAIAAADLAEAEIVHALRQEAEVAADRVDGVLAIREAVRALASPGAQLADQAKAQLDGEERRMMDQLQHLMPKEAVGFGIEQMFGPMLRLLGAPSPTAAAEALMLAEFTAAQVRASKGDLEAAIDLVGRAAALAQEYDHPIGWRIATLRAELLLEADRPGDAVIVAAAAIDDLRRDRAGVAGQEVGRAQRIGAARRAADPRDIAVEALLRQPVSAVDAERALQITEESQGGFLLDLLARSGSDPLSALAARAARTSDPMLANDAARALTRLQSLRAERDRIEVDPAADAQQRDQVRRQLAAAEAQIARLAESHLRSATFESLTVNEVSAAMEPGELLLQYHIGPRMSAVYVMESGRRPFVVPLTLGDGAALTRETASSLSNDFHRFCQEGGLLDPDLYDAMLARSVDLSTAILPARVRPYIEAARTVLVVPDGPLQLVAFDALPLDLAPSRVPGELWIDRYAPVVTGPSATTLLWSRARRTLPAPDREGVLAIGDPAFEPGESRLESSGEEARKIAEMANAAGGPFSPAVVLTGDRVSPDAVVEGVAKPRIVHLGTHGTFESGDRVVESAVKLAADSDGRARRITLEDLLSDWGGRLEGVELVVLSACQTARGGNVSGEGMIALPWGFLYAGVDATIASRWAISDASTSGLMVRFYENLTGSFKDTRRHPSASFEAATRMTAADALAEAKIWTRQNIGAEPYHWAAFMQAGLVD